MCVKLLYGLLLALWANGLIGKKNTPEKLFTHRDLKSQFNIRYLKHNLITADAQKLLQKAPLAADKEYQENKEHYDNLAKKYKKLIAAGYTAPLVIKWVNSSCGFGVFARKNIKKDSLIGEYTGIVRSHTVNPDSKYAFAYPTMVIEGKENDDLVIDAADSGNVTRFVNHSTTHKNVENSFFYDDSGRHVIFYAGRDIKAGEQLFIDYGPDYWEKLGIQPEDICG